MSEWWTYSLSDLLLFSPRTYYRLLELYNRDLWPAHVATMASGAALVVLAARRPAMARRPLGVLLALAWAWVAWGFLLQRYATINWAATHAAAAFVLQAALLAAFAFAGRGEPRPAPVFASRLGLGVAAFAVVAYPAVAVLAGRSLASAETFALTPDPTALATLGFLACSGRWRWVLLPIPLAWCAVSTATLWTMAAPDAWVLPLATVAVLVAAVRATAGTSGPRPSPSAPSRSRSRRAPRR